MTNVKQIKIENWKPDFCKKKYTSNKKNTNMI